MSDNYSVWKRQIVEDAKKYKTLVAAQFELTSRCNLDCKMCYVHNQNSNSLLHRELSTEQWKKIMDDAFDAGMMFATLTGGECLIRKDFQELYMHLWNKGVFISVLSNGTLLNDEILAMFQQHRPELVRISLYGHNEEVYRRVTGHSQFEKAFSAIQKLKKANLPLHVTVTCSKYMADTYIDALKYIKSTGINPVLSELRLIPKRDDKTQCDHYLSDDEIVRIAVERRELFGGLHSCPALPEYGGPKNEPDTYGLTCNAGNSYAFITWEGKMLPCATIDIKEKPSLLEMSFKEAWDRVVKATSEIVQPAECDGCSYSKACPKCIALRTSDLYSGHCSLDVCKLTQRLVQEGAVSLHKETSHEEDGVPL